jgi:hypothetical protein
MNDVLYKIHSVDVEEVGLGDYGKKGISVSQSPSSEPAIHPAWDICV